MISSIDPRFKKVDTAGAGGFSVADLYFDTNLERYVIIKKLQDSNEIDRLLDEIEALQNAKSKHIVQIYDIIFDKETPVAIVEEFIPGSDLMKFEFDPLDTQRYIKTLYQLAKGLADIHGCKIVHRDFKPNNVKFDDEGIIKIFDFGLAKNEIPASTIGQIGTPGFMAPELFWSKPLIDKPVDCYSFACTAFFLASKSPPNCSLSKPPKEKKTTESIKNHVKLNNSEITSLIDRCLDLDPDNRPTMNELCVALKKELLYGKFNATLCYEGNIHKLNEVDSGVKVSRTSETDWAIIRYNGYNYVAKEVNGDVYVNNNRINKNFIFPKSTVITLGHPNLKGSRRYMTLDISHPEVVL